MTVSIKPILFLSSISYKIAQLLQTIDSFHIQRRNIIMSRKLRED